MMPPQRRLEVQLLHMRDAAQNALTYPEGMAFDDFMREAMVREAVAMNLVIAGECANTVSQKHPEFEAQYPGFALRQMRAMRNRIAHGYVDLDFAIVWDIVNNDLPSLIAQLDAMLDPPGR